MCLACATRMTRNFEAFFFFVWHLATVRSARARTRAHTHNHDKSHYTAVRKDAKHHIV